MRWPIGRPTTVRARIVALALAPVIALMVLWSFAMVSVTGELRALIRVQGVYEDFGTPVDTAIGQIQIERRLAAAYLGGGPRTQAGVDLLEQQRRTDRAVTAMRDAIRDGDRSRLSDRQRQVLGAALTAVDKLEGLRERVLSRRISWDRAVTEYGALVEPGFEVQSALTALQAGQMAREAQVIVELVRVREFVSREDALVAGARAAGTLTDRQYDMLTATIEDRRVFERTYVPALPSDSRALFEEFQRGDVHRALTRGEDALLRAGAAGAGRAVAADSWRTTTDRAVKRYMQLCTRAAENSAARGRAFAYRELAKAAVVGVLGLAAVGLSLWFAVRGARRISRRLETLRDSADLLTTRQLPDVMARLSAGEEVDATAEAPPLADEELRPDEIGQVGRSFNAARLAAVEAAVKQATLRRGLFAVLLNIARRNQALVHRQLKLVDTLERRTEDPDTLQELFRIDHLTTRMRRHAESLIILSGAVPGRRWRRPVPVADVVSSAVSEIEDYARVEVPPMPEVGVAADAVADVVHLIAELLENATVFSPPHTRVTLRSGRARGGFVLEIDDRGLGLGPDQIEEAHRTLTRPDDFDPTRHERLGLYVVGRLAARHGIGVTLTRSPYGGTTAVVLLPEAVLADVVPEPPVREAEAQVRALPSRRGTAALAQRWETSRAGGGNTGRATDRASDAERPGRPDVETPGPPDVERPGPPDVERPGHPDAETPGRPDVERPGRPDGERRPGRPDAETPGRPDVERPGRPYVETPDRPDPADPSPDASESTTGAIATPGARVWTSGAAATPGAPASTGGAAATPGAPASTGGAAATPGAPAPAPEAPAPTPKTPALPTRVRQTSLAPALRTEAPPADEPPGREVSAEEVRAIFGAFQRGLDRGRKGLLTGTDRSSPTDAHQGGAGDIGWDGPGDIGWDGPGDTGRDGSGDTGSGGPTNTGRDGPGKTGRDSSRDTRQGGPRDTDPGGPPSTKERTPTEEGTDADDAP
ncbi:nitrate- and nitrite sensing domain-containing protein [Streptomyces sp. NPDC005202]|uniref:nitrate- and nitrite sensing domain-containing protein n=1 Tax=Streptomyces sp. NPDC005202 TaxID=3157021 RepID=UPI0033A8C7A8